MQITLKACRVNKGWTQAEAAKELEISESLLSLIERNKAFPDVRLIERMVAKYGVPYDSINFLPKNNG